MAPWENWCFDFINHTIIILTRANSVKDVVLWRFSREENIWKLTGLLSCRWSCCYPSSVEVISVPMPASSVVNTAALGAKILPQLARWSTVPRCSCLFSTAHPHNETASLRQFALTQHSGGACRCSSCTSKHWRKWASPGPQESNSQFHEICIMFLSCQAAGLSDEHLHTDVSILLSGTRKANMLSQTCVIRSLMFAQSFSVRVLSHLLLYFLLFGNHCDVVTSAVAP